MSKVVNSACPACGFITFNMPSDRYEFCEICHWQDDEVQHSYPAVIIGANKISLCEFQLQVLKIYPTEILEAKNFKRDKNWQPFTDEDCQPKEGQPRNGKEWFDKMPGKRVTYIDGKYK